MGTSFEVLNQILQEEHLAIKHYQAYIDALPESPLRNHLVAFVTDHKNHATRLAYFIQTNGGHVLESLGLTSKLTIWRTRLEQLTENDPLMMLEELHSRENQGLAKAVELSHDLSASEKEILAPMFADDQAHLKQLESLREGLLQ